MITQTIKQQSDMRQQKAELILAKGNPEILEDNTYLVPSQYSDKKYLVSFYDSYSCNCPDFQHTCKGKGLYCKHIKTILLFKKLKQNVETIKEETLFIETPQKEICPYCSCEDMFKRGKRKTQLGTKQLYCCKSCKKRFVLSPIKNIKGNAKFVCLAMDCYYRGLSYRDISHQFEQFYNLKISHVTIRTWVLKFSKNMEKYTKTIQPNIKGIWNADETMILSKRGKTKVQNSEYDYVWNVMDNKTKFLLASINSGRSRNKKDAQKVMTEALNQNGTIPFQIITDRCPSYQDGIRKTFRNWGNERKVKHTSIVGKRHIVNNNAIESHHTHQKEFHKIRRGVTETQDYQDGFKIFHNFVRKSARENLTPADKCNIGLNGNRWESLLLKSIKHEKATCLTGEQKMEISH